MSLKKAKALLQKDNDPEGALDELTEVLKSKPNDYNAILLKGKALQTLEKPHEALDAYAEASKLEPTKPFAWKGLIGLAISSKNCTKLLHATEGLVQAMEAEDPQKNLDIATENWNKTCNFIRKNGDNAEKHRLLRAQLPGSPAYSYLHARMPPESLTLNTLIKDNSKELSRALSRLKVRAKQNISLKTADVEAEELKLRKNSDLENLYQQLANSNDASDEVRYSAEAELLEFQYRMLELLPPQEKPKLAETIKDQASSLVLFNTPQPLAFLVHFVWSDVKSYEDFDPTLLLKFKELFPENGLSNIIDAFLHSVLNPFKLTQEDGEQELLWSHQEIVDAFNVGLQTASSNMLANRIVADYYMQSEDYEKAADYAKEGLKLCVLTTNITSVSFPNSKLAFSLILGTSYIYYQAPKNFGLASKLFKSVLDQEPENVDAKVASALLLLQTNELERARTELEELVAANPENYTALSELAWCQIRTGDYVHGQENTKKCLELVLAKGSAQQIADRRALLFWRLGYSFWATKDYKQAYDNFVTALQQNPSFAPAYTYLGLFYSSKGDESRAKRCFYKALEIDNGEVIAGYRLASDFADQSQWDLVEIVTSRVLDSDKNLDPVTGERIDWPYRAMGIACLNRRDYSEAVKYFQQCLRLVPQDANSWVGLGEAYIHSGRYSSAVKALTRALELDPNNLSALYELSVAQRETLQFADAAKSLQKALQINDSLELQGALVETYVHAANSYLSDSFLGDAIDTAKTAIVQGLQALKASPNYAGIWSSLASGVEVFLVAQSHEDKVPFDELHQLCDLAKVKVDDSDKEAFFLAIMILCCEQAQDNAGESRGSRAVATFNVGLAHLKAFTMYHASQDHHRPKAVKFLQQALTLERRNHSYWSTYGVAIQSLNPRIAQHCFIRSLNLFPREPITWANLGLLYLSHGILDLASEAFDRALSVEPDEAASWVGQALGEYLSGKNTTQVMRLFEHSYLISSGKDRISKLLLGVFAFITAKDSGKVDHVAVGALEKLLALDPKNRQALLYYGLLLERTGSFEESAKQLSRLIDVPGTNKSSIYCDLARLHLGNHDWDGAIQYATRSLEENPDEERVQLSAILTSGLAYYFNKDFDSALEMFTTALELTDHSQDVVVLLVQVLWESGGDDARDAATEQLFESVENKGSSVQVSLLLGIIGFLNSDSDIVSATIEELQNLPIEAMKNDTAGDIAIVSSKLQDSAGPLYRDLFFNPTKYSIWKEVDKEIALDVAQTNEISCNELSEAYTAVESLEASRRAVFYSPASEKAWNGLARCAANAPVQEQASELSQLGI